MQKTFEDMQKVMMLVKAFPKNTLDQTIALLIGMPEVYINAAIWYGEEYGYFKLPEDPKTQPLQILKEPETWSLGSRVEEIQQAILFCYRTNLQKREYDLDDEEMARWLRGHTHYDTIVAVKGLIETGHMASYELVDPKDLKSVYTFYTLKEDEGKNWGRSRFPQQQPTGDEVADTSEPEEDAKNE